VARTRELTGGLGADVVVDSVGDTLAGSLACLAYRGRAITVGDASRARSPIDVSVLMGGNQSLIGVFLGAEAFFNPARVHPMIGGHLDAIARGELAVVVDSTFPLADAVDAHRRAESREAFGRVVMIP
jgi:NADPH2:quinone reductase